MKKTIYNKKSRLNYSLKEINNLSRKNNKENVLYWIFLDCERLSDYKKFIEQVPTSKRIGVVMRTKNKHRLYNKSKILLKLCKRKKFTFIISTNKTLAKAVGADGVHYSKEENYARRDKTILSSCSCHGYRDFRRVRNLNVDFTFISPIFITESNLNKKPLGLKKISLLANYIKCKYSILGGVRRDNIRNLRNRGISSISGLEYILETARS